MLINAAITFTNIFNKVEGYTFYKFEYISLNNNKLLLLATAITKTTTLYYHQYIYIL